MIRNFGRLYGGCSQGGSGGWGGWGGFAGSQGLGILVVPATEILKFFLEAGCGSGPGWGCGFARSEDSGCARDRNPQVFPGSGPRVRGSGPRVRPSVALSAAPARPGGLPPGENLMIMVARERAVAVPPVTPGCWRAAWRAPFPLPRRKVPPVGCREAFVDGFRGARRPPIAVHWICWEERPSGKCDGDSCHRDDRHVPKGPRVLHTDTCQAILRRWLTGQPGRPSGGAEPAALFPWDARPCSPPIVCRPAGPPRRRSPKTRKNPGGRGREAGLRSGGDRPVPQPACWRAHIPGRGSSTWKARGK
ncbi:hypothetical protein Ga0074812_12342 [Parafrankia irregularis]|uniref:Uncharacterized protein n=1 Tax=Parafrankia irregularis TaxID=795642 RepID=A0A0S4QV71_9ACTN|nr:hypothetical protein Ga0074812_12342 [Parafrankia irregularis]